MAQQSKGATNSIRTVDENILTTTGIDFDLSKVDFLSIILTEH